MTAIPDPPVFADVARSIEDPEGYILALHEAGDLDYREPGGWVYRGVPLPERLQLVAQQVLVESGLIHGTDPKEVSQ